MRRTFIPLGIALILCVTFAAAADKLTFEVASVRPSLPITRGAMISLGTHGGPGTADPERITSSHVILKTLLMNAYGVRVYQISGPAWLETTQYDIVAKVPPGTTKEQVKLMWQSLLTDRFGIVLHRESKEFRVEELVVAKGGAKLTRSAMDPEAASAADPSPTATKVDKDGLPVVDGVGLQALLALGFFRLTAKAQPISALVPFLEGRLRVENRVDVPIMDKTGLTGLYDFTLKYAPNRARGGTAADLPPAARIMAAGGDASTPAVTPDDPAGANLATALQEQLGLKLTPAKASLEVLVIDSANEVPTEN